MPETTTTKRFFPILKRPSCGQSDHLLGAFDLEWSFDGQRYSALSLGCFVVLSSYLRKRCPVDFSYLCQEIAAGRAASVRVSSSLEIYLRPGP